MATAKDLPIFADAYNFVRDIYQMTHKFPRAFKYCLGEQLNRDALMLLCKILQANRSAQERVRHLDTCLSTLDIVRMEIRLCRDLNVLSVRQLAHLALSLDKIAKQATSWQKYHKSRYNKQENSQETLPELDITKHVDPSEQL